GCGGDSGVRGERGEWINGSNLSVNVTFVSGAHAMIDVRNDSPQPVTITPMKVTAWFEDAGRVASSNIFGVFDAESPLIQAQFEVTAKDGGSRFLTADDTNPDLTLQSGESVTLPLGVWTFSAEPTDRLRRVRVSIGPPGAEEIFTIE
ncbi:hypothetical protein ACFL5A_05015, partial [Gemmatimonadota bacterium]